MHNSVHVVELADEAERWLRFADAHGVSVLHWREARGACRPRHAKIGHGLGALHV